MDTRRGCANVANGFFIHLSNRVCERSSGINYTLCPDIPFFPSNLITYTSTRNLFISFAIFILGKVDLVSRIRNLAVIREYVRTYVDNISYHSHVISYSGSQTSRSERDCNVHTSIVMLAVIVHNCTTKFVFP